METQMSKKKTNELDGWFDAINESQKFTQQSDEEWRQAMGEPQKTLEIEGGKLGFWRLENGDVLTARIVKDRAVRSSAQVYTQDFVCMLTAIK